MDYAHFYVQILAEFYARKPKGTTGAEQPEANKEENLIDA